MWKYVIAIGIICFVIVLYVVTYAINAKTEKPEGCEETECSACNTTNCPSRK